MARGGDPRLNWIEDEYIVASLLRAPLEDKQVLDVVRSFLERKFPDIRDGRIDKFLEYLEIAARGYLSLLIAEIGFGQDASRSAVLQK